jgi:hypothetical protein
MQLYRRPTAERKSLYKLCLRRSKKDSCSASVANRPIWTLSRLLAKTMFVTRQRRFCTTTLLLRHGSKTDFFRASGCNWMLCNNGGQVSRIQRVQRVAGSSHVLRPRGTRPSAPQVRQWAVHVSSMSAMMERTWRVKQVWRWQLGCLSCESAVPRLPCQGHSVCARMTSGRGAAVEG